MASEPAARLEALVLGRHDPATAPSVAAPVPVHDSERAAEILDQFRLHLTPGLREATIELRPAELGRISIRLTVESGRINATLRAEKRATLDVLGRHLPELRASLSKQGIETESFDLALGFQNDGTQSGNGPRPHAARVGRERRRRALASALAEHRHDTSPPRAASTPTLEAQRRPKQRGA